MSHLVDYHIHSRLSPDASDEVDTLCQRAIEANLAEICLTDHAEFDPKDSAYENYSYEASQRQIAHARARFGDQLEIRLGVEVGYQECYKEDIRRFLTDKNFDMVLGAVHQVDHLFLNPREFFAGRREDEVVRLYFQEVLRGVKSGLFDVMAHLDLVKRHGVPYFGPFMFDKYAVYFEEVLKAMVEHGVGLEINTSGLRHPPKEPYPGLKAVRLYRELGGEIVTIGSDAHRAEHVGHGLEVGLELARTAGFKAIALFRGRQPTFTRIV